MKLSRLLAIAALVAVPLATPALAFDCNTPVTDDAGVFNGDLDGIKSAADDLQSKGAFAYVRTFSSIPDESMALDQYIKDDVIAKQCSSWQSPNGGTRENLVVVTLDMKSRKAFIIYGDQYESALGNGRAEAIVTDELVPRLKQGDFPGGFFAALSAVQENIENHATLETSGGATTIVNEKPADYKPVGHAMETFFSFLFFGVVLFAALFFGWRWSQRRKAENEARSKAQQKAQLAKADCTTAINGFISGKKLVVLDAKLNEAVKTSSQEDVKPLRDALSGLIVRWGNANGAYSRISDTGVADPATSGLTASAYDAIGAEYENLSATLTSIITDVNAFEGKVTALTQSVADAPNKVAAAKDTYDAAGAAIAEVAQTGFKVGAPSAILDEAKAALDNANTLVQAKRFTAAITAAALCITKSAAATTAAKDLATTKKSIESLIAKAQAHGTKAMDGVTAAKTAFDDIMRTYAQSSWTNVRGNGTEALNKIHFAGEAIAQATTAIGMDVQDWQKGSELVKQAESLLDDADHLTGTIMQLAGQLADAKRKSSSMLEATSVDIKKASAYIDAHRADVKPQLGASLDTAKDLLAQAQAEFKKDLPDYIQVVRLAQQADKAADDVFAEASSEFEAAERKRRQAADLTNEASRSISAADSYIKSHRSDVESSAITSLDRARTAYDQAKRATSIDGQIANANSANEAADQALRSAKSNVSDAEDDRRRKQEAAERRRREREDEDDSSFTTGAIIGAAATHDWGTPHPSYSGGGGNFGGGGFGGGFGGGGFHSSGGSFSGGGGFHSAGGSF